MSLEGEQIFYTFQGQNVEEQDMQMDDIVMSKEEALIKFIKFIREWERNGVYFYR